MSGSNKRAVPESEWISTLPTVDRESTKRRLISDFPITTWMLPYIGRNQEFRVRNFQGDRAPLLKSFQEMNEILEAKGAACLRARKISYRALDVACHHQAEKYRLAQEQAEYERAHENREQLVDAIAKLKEILFGRSRSPLRAQAIGKLNVAMRNQDWRAFDTELFGTFLADLLRALKEELPQETATAAWTIICGLPSTELKERPETPEHLEQLALAGPLMRLWEVLPSETRATVEENIRCCWKPPARKPLAVFLEKLCEILRCAKLRSRKGRPFAIHRRYLRTIERLCDDADLKPGLVKRERDRESAPRPQPRSPFQRFARAALAAVGPDIPISQLQVLRLKRKTGARLNI